MNKIDDALLVAAIDPEVAETRMHRGESVFGSRKLVLELDEREREAVLYAINVLFEEVRIPESTVSALRAVRSRLCERGGR